MISWLVRLYIQGRTLDVYGVIVSNALYDTILIALWSQSTVYNHLATSLIQNSSHCGHVTSIKSAAKQGCRIVALVRLRKLRSV